MDDLTSDLQRQLADSEARHIQRLVGLRVHHTTQVSIRKPRHMPNWLYLRLMRTIVVVNGPIILEGD